MQDFRNLKVWEKGHALTLSIYRASGGFPNHEMFGLTSQMRRSAYSIPMNIAEGCGRGSDADFSRFLQIAMDHQVSLITSAFSLVTSVTWRKSVISSSILTSRRLSEC